MPTRYLFVTITIVSYLIGAPLAAQPFIVGETARDELVSEQNWERVDELSDEFSGPTLATDKWDTRSIVPGRFFWLGRWPGLFEPENIHLEDDELRMEAKIFAEPKADELDRRSDWTHGGAILRSHNLVQPGMYAEAEMRTTNTIMSGTFWLTTPAANCNNIPKAELDVTESIGIKTGVFKEPELGWYAPVADRFEFGMNASCRQRSSDCLPAVNRDGAWGDFDPSADFHVYGVYWESPTRIHFYLDGFHRFTITPATPFADPMAIIMALETYDFNYPSDDPASDGFEGTLAERSTRYKWVRTWRVGTTSTRVADGEEEAAVTLFPNPSGTGQITVRNQESVRFSAARILDARGGLAREFTALSGVEVSLSVADLTPGLYCVQLQVAGDRWVSRKVVIR